GASTPSTLPVWRRELLSARNPPRVTCNHYEYEELVDTKGTVTPLDDIAHKSFFFGLLRLQPFVALQPDPEDEMRIMCLVNARKKFNPSIPVGYYGNAFCYPAAISTARDLVKKPLGYTLELVIKVKSYVTEEYMRSVADLMVTKGRPLFTIVQSYIVSDVTHAGFDNVDFGWGKATFAGPSRAGVGAFPSASFYTPFTNYKGESGIVVPICLSNVAMNKFEQELNNMFVQAEGNLVVQEHNLPAISKL
nr:benzyl alcohol O-benzoyltransferase [Tanacetum cinerariifolium]